MPFINQTEQFAPYFWLYNIESREPENGKNTLEMYFKSIWRIKNAESFLVATMMVPTVDINNKHLKKEKRKEHQYFFISIAQEEQN